MKLLSWLLLWNMTLTIYPDMFRVTFPADDSNSAIMLIVISDSNGKPYQQVDEVPIAEADQTTLDIPRHVQLPRGASYVIEAQLVRWEQAGDGTWGELPVDSVKTIIHVP